MLESPDEPRHDPAHDRRVTEAVARAHGEVPFYSSRSRRIPASTETAAEALTGLPLLTKKALGATLPKQWVPRGRDARVELASGAIELTETRGTAGARIRVLAERGWWERQERRGRRTSSQVCEDAERGDREAVLSTPERGMGSCHSGDPSFEERLEGTRLVLNSRQDPTFWTPVVMDRMLDELERHAPLSLEADPAYLAVLARHAAQSGKTLHVAGHILSSHAQASRAHLRAIARVCSHPVVERYGARAVGALFIGGEDGRLHHAPFTSHVELLPAKVPAPGASGLALVVVTTLDREVMPLVRFVVGDLVCVDLGIAPRFTTVHPLSSVEGRLDDALVRPDGALITAGAIDRALAGVPLRAFQATQERPERVTLDIVPEDAREAERAQEAARSGVSELLGGLALDVRVQTAIGPEPSGKFRLSRRAFPLDLAGSFEGCDGALEGS